MITLAMSGWAGFITSLVWLAASPWRRLARARARQPASQIRLDRTKTRGARTGYVFLHSAIDGHSLLAYTEALPDEKAVTTVAFLDRART